eukprot:scaffold241_cov340-Pavlova_lutheri.AAC.5
MWKGRSRFRTREERASHRKCGGDEWDLRRTLLPPAPALTRSKRRGVVPCLRSRWNAVPFLSIRPRSRGPASTFDAARPTSDRWRPSPIFTSRRMHDLRGLTQVPTQSFGSAVESHLCAPLQRPPLGPPSRPFPVPSIPFPFTSIRTAWVSMEEGPFPLSPHHLGLGESTQPQERANVRVCGWSWRLDQDRRWCSEGPRFEHRSRPPKQWRRCDGGWRRVERILDVVVVWDRDERGGKRGDQPRHLPHETGTQPQGVQSQQLRHACRTSEVAQGLAVRSRTVRRRKRAELHLLRICGPVAPVGSGIRPIRVQRHLCSLLAGRGYHVASDHGNQHHHWWKPATGDIWKSPEPRLHRTGTRLLLRRNWVPKIRCMPASHLHALLHVLQ